MQSSSEPFITWYLTDGKPGHENQSSGLLNALARYVPVQAHGIPVASGLGTIGWWALKIFPPAKDLPNPHLIIGAGHGTHIPLLAARRARGGRTVVLMRPSLPFSWYDLCLIPEHDGIEAGANVVLTRGVLNKVASGGIHDPSRGLILLGGPSRHYNWDSQSILWQVQSLLKQEKMAYQWVLSTSRRTPPSMLTALRNLQFSNLQVFAGETTPPGWITEQLALAGRVWVSEDSVSMVYEALTCGAAVGVLNVPCKAWGRVVRGLDSLAEKGVVTTFTAWRQGQKLAPPRQQFNEADRCAQILVERWLSGP